MSDRDGSSTMRTLRLDRDTADRLLAGRVAPDDAPPGYADLARLVATVSAPPAPRELTRLNEDVEAAAAIRSRRSASTVARRAPSRPRSRFARVRTVTLVAAGTVVATSGLAAAGVLPDPIQDVVSDVLSHVGITVPEAEDDRESGDGPDGPGAPMSPIAVVPEPPIADAPATPPGAPRERSHGGSADEHGGTSSAVDPKDAQHVNGPPHDTPGNGPPADTPGNGPPADTPGNGPPADTPGNGPPDDTPGNGPPADTPGNGPPDHTPGNGPPADTPGNGPPDHTPGNGPPTDPGGGQGGSPAGLGS